MKSSTCAWENMFTSTLMRTHPELTCSCKHSFRPTCQVWLTHSRRGQGQTWAHPVGSCTFSPLFVFPPLLPASPCFFLFTSIALFSLSLFVCVCVCVCLFVCECAFYPLSCLCCGCSSIICYRKGCVSVSMFESVRWVYVHPGKTTGLCVSVCVYIHVCLRVCVCC